MQQHLPESNELPAEPCSLGLELSYPLSCLSSIQNGYEAQHPDDKWSIYYRNHWVQIWRPTNDGLYCYAIRFEQSDSQRIRIAESWVSSKIFNDKRWLGPDFERHWELVTWLLDSVAGFAGERFEHGSLSGTRQRKMVTFSGEATSIDDVDVIADKLRVEVTRMLKDGW